MRSLNILLPFLFIPIVLFSGTSCKKDEEESVAKPEKPYSEEAPEGYIVYDSESQKFWLDTVVSGLAYPWGMAFLPDGDLLVSERPGRLQRVRPDGEATEISGLPEIAAVGQGGLLDIQLHPEYDQNGWIYLAYSRKAGPLGSTTTAIARAKLNGNALADLEQIFIAQPSFSTTHHYGCRMVLKDGYLFFGVGDRGQMQQAQRLDRHNGKIMRIYDDGRVPMDNPFVSVNEAKAEIWSYGHRNPQGLALHPISGELWEHEHGPKGGDELNIVRRGNNYGWPVITYGIDYDGTVISPITHKEGMEQPVTFWVPSIAPCGMIFNSGDKYTGWKGNIFIGALAGRAFYRVVLNGNTYSHQEKLLPDIGRVRNVALSPDGFIYIATESPNHIYRVVPINE